MVSRQVWMAASSLMTEDRQRAHLCRALNLPAKEKPSEVTAEGF